MTELTETELQGFRVTLLEEKARILAEVHASEAEDVQIDGDDLADEIDNAVADSNVSFTGRMREREHGLLAQVERSLLRIEQGCYGECSGCGEEIGLARLTARPMADACIDCKNERERLGRLE